MQEPQDVQQTQAAQDAQQTQAMQDVQQVDEAPVTAVKSTSGRTLGLAALAGAVVVGVLAVGFALGSGSSSNDTAIPAAAPAAAGAPARIAQAGWTSPDGRTQVRLDGRGERGFHGGMDQGYITITAIDGNNLSLKTTDNWTRTIDATGATVTNDGKTVELSTLKVGDHIVFRETRNADGTYTTTAIAVVQPTVAGTVASVSGSTVSVTAFDGSTAKVALTGSTTYTLDGATATKDAVVAGARILARGTLGSDGTLTATSVEIEPAMAAGTVKAKGTSNLTLTLRDGSTLEVTVTATTTYQVEGVTTATLADVKVGDLVMASGTKNADGSLTATAVRTHSAGTFGGPGFGGPGMGDGGMGGWGRGGHGMGGWMGGWGDPGASPAPSTSPTNGTNG